MLRRIALITLPAALIGVPLVAGAAGTNVTFVSIVPLPFTVDVGAADAIGKYLQGLFKLVFSLAGVLAVAMLVIGGFEYMTSEAMGGKSKGRERIQGAMIGLILLIASYLILNVINPCLLELNPLRGLGSGGATKEVCAGKATPGDNGSSLRNPAGSGLNNGSSNAAPNVVVPADTTRPNDSVYFGYENGQCPNNVQYNGSSYGCVRQANSWFQCWTGQNTRNGPDSGCCLYQKGAPGQCSTTGTAPGTSPGGGTGTGTGAGGNTSSSATPATGARSSYRGAKLVPSGMALVCYPGACPATGPGQYGNLLPFPELNGADAQAACGGNPSVQSACIYGNDQWLDQSHVNDLLQMDQAFPCPQTGNRYSFLADDATFCAPTSQLCTVQNVYRAMNGAQNVTDCTLSPGNPTI